MELMYITLLKTTGRTHRGIFRRLHLLIYENIVITERLGIGSFSFYLRFMENFVWIFMMTIAIEESKMGHNIFL